MVERFSPQERIEEILGESGTSEQLKKWVETGFSDEAVFMTGISEYVLLQLLQEGTLPARQRSDADGFKHRDEFERVNYVFPIPEKVRALKPDLIAKMEEQLVPTRDQLGLQELKKSAQTYALAAAIKDAFFAQTDIRLSTVDVLFLLRALDQSAYQNFCDQHPKEYYYTDEYSLDFDTDKKKCQEVLDDPYFTKEELLRILVTAVRHRGAVLYLNQKVLGVGKIEEGVEDEREIVILTKEGIPKEAVSGVELLR